MKTAHFGIRHKDDGKITTTTEGQLNIFETREAAQQCIDGPQPLKIKVNGREMIVPYIS